MKSCCSHTSKDKKCIRSSDQKIFMLPRKFSKKRCRRAKGFTMKSSCAPYKGCYKKKSDKRDKRTKRTTRSRKRIQKKKTKKRSSP